MGDDDSGPSSQSKASPLRFLASSRLYRVLIAAAAFAGLAFFAAPVSAHGRLGAAEGRCRLYVGPDWMNFTGYLPDASKNEFCEDIPSTGHMIMALDTEQPELREMPIEIRIVKDVGGPTAESADLGAVTVAHRDARLYPTGTINFEHEFKEPGYFVGIVTVKGGHGEEWVSRFPFSVGKSYMRDMPAYVLLTLGVLFGCWIYMRHRLHAVANTKPPVAPAPTPAE
jgi:hypothetical protein